MATLICGSLAFDTIMSFEGRFAEQILPDQLHILNVSFLVPSLRRDFGGCAGNIAYAMRQLGGTPLPVATLGGEGCDIWEAGVRSRVPPVQAASVVDPTGCGDAWRGGASWTSAPSSCAPSTTPTPRRP